MPIERIAIYRKTDPGLVAFEVFWAWTFLAIVSALKYDVHWAIALLLWIIGQGLSWWLLGFRVIQTLFALFVTVLWAGSAFYVVRYFDPNDWIGPAVVSGLVGLISLGYHLNALREAPDPDSEVVYYRKTDQA